MHRSSAAPRRLSTLAPTQSLPSPPLTLYFCTQSMTRSAPRVVMPALAPWPSTSTTMAYCSGQEAPSAGNEDLVVVLPIEG